jgi:hypothetical protein
MTNNSESFEKKYNIESGGQEPIGVLAPSVFRGGEWGTGDIQR